MILKTVLKDRASAGKIALSLEKKGYIKVSLQTKNNRPVKILTPTKKGANIHEKVYKTLHPFIKKIEDEVSTKVIEDTIQTLKHFKKAVKNTITSNI